METVTERLGIWQRKKRCIISSFCAGCSTECLRFRPFLSKCQEKKKDSSGIQQPGGAVKALQRLFVLILLGFHMQGVKAEPQETLKFQDFEKDRCLNHRAEVGSRRRMTQTCSIRQEEEERKSQERDPGSKKKETARARTRGPLQRTARVGTPALLKETARKRTRAPSKETARRGTQEPQMAEATKWKGGALRRSERKKIRRRERNRRKKVKYRRRSW